MIKKTDGRRFAEGTLLLDFVVHDPKNRLCSFVPGEPRELISKMNLGFEGQAAS